MIDLTPLVQAVIGLGAALITAYVVPYIRSKSGGEKLEQMKAWARIGVKAAEQLYPVSGQGNLKKQYVVDFLKQHGYTVDFTELEAFIESAVNEMKNEQNLYISDGEDDI